MGRMLILAGLVGGLVGLAGDSQPPPSIDATSSVQPPVASPESNELCPKGSVREEALAIIEPAVGKCSLNVYPETICVKSGGTISWLVDARRGDPQECRRELRKIKLKDFKLLGGKGDPADPFAAGKCAKEVDKPDRGLYLIKCIVRDDKELSGKNYEYSIVGVDSDGNQVTVADPEIGVRG